MYAVILAGGGGTRLWPLSRRARPKPFLPLLGDETPFQRTLARLTPLIARADAYVICEERLMPLVREQAPYLDDRQLITEPLGRNTAAAVCLAALAIEREPEEVMAVLPADAHIPDDGLFRDALEQAAAAAADGSFVVLGIEPSGPETGYGYVLAAERADGVRRVARFVEKPGRDVARTLLQDPAGAWWNAGIFVWRRDALLAGLQRHAAQLLAPLHDALTQGRPLADVYPRLEQTSIDYALLEPASLNGDVKVLPVELGWRDLGSWAALRSELAAGAAGDGSGVVGVGRVEDLESDDVLVHSTAGRLVVTVGLRGTIVVDTPDVVLVCDGERAQDVRRIVDRLAAAKETDYL